MANNIGIIAVKFAKRYAHQNITVYMFESGFQSTIMLRGMCFTHCKTEKSKKYTLYES